jgi:hypothetical protein
MKLKHLLLIPLLCLAFISKAQLTADFPDSNYHWNEIQEYYDLDFPHRNIYFNGTMYIAGNINLSNKTFQKINYKYIQTYFRYDSNFVLHTIHSNCDRLLGYVLNDKPNKKVFFKPDCSFFFGSDTTLKILYDFGLNIGDKYPITLNNSDTILTVKRIDTIIDPFGIKRAVYFIYDDPQSKSSYKPVIQGLGFCGGLLNPNLQQAFEGYRGNIECFSFNNQNYSYSVSMDSTILYLNSCDIIQFVGINSSKKSEITISPNPVTSTFTINIPDEEATFSILNTLGQVQKMAIIREGIIWKLDASLLENGIYFINILTDKNHYSSRFIKAN